jgi:hypothetical protein
MALVNLEKVGSNIYGGSSLKIDHEHSDLLTNIAAKGNSSF